MRKMLDTIGTWANHVVVAAFILMFFLVFSNVVLRFLFSTGLTFSDEIARYAFVWCTFLGAVIAMQRNAHIGIAGIRTYLPEAVHPWLDALVNLIKLVVTLIVLTGSIEFLVANLGTRAPFTGAPIAIAQASIVTGAAGLILIFAHRLWNAVRRGRR